MRRGIALGVPGVALATAGGLLAQVRQVANAPLPHFEDLDPSGRYGRAGGAPLRMAVLGDSSLTGPGLGASEDVWIARIAARSDHDVELVSHARGGSRVRNVLVEQAPAALADRPDLIVLSVGANDALHATPLRSFERQLSELLDVLGAAAPVLALGIGDLSVIPRLPLTFQFMAARRSAAIDRVHKVAAADRDQVARVPVARLTDGRFRETERALFAEDLFHLNGRGHAVWADLFEPYVASAMARAVGQPGLMRPTPAPAGRP